jgi:hypothetical protein
MLAVGSAPVADVRYGGSSVAAVHLGGEKVWPTRSGFWPTDVADCALWLDADDPATLTLTGQDVTAWTDKSTRGWAFDRVLGTPPTTGSTVNGRNALHFADGGLQTGRGPAPVSPDGSWTAYAVIVSESRGTVQTILDGDKDGLQDNAGIPTRLAQILRLNAADRIESITFSGGTPATDAGPVVPSGAPTLVSAVRRAANVEAYANGVSDGPTAAGAANKDMTPLALGRHSTVSTAAQHFTGSICEAIIYARVLAPQEAAAVDTYLRMKWGIT